jgi:hypothetical protein
MLLLLCLACLISNASAQAPTLVIVLNDGTEQRISVDDIQSLKFTPLALPEYTAMRIEPHRMSDVENDHVYPREIDSITFSASSLGSWQLNFAVKPEAANFFYDPVTITSQNGWERVDSIQFFRYRKNVDLLQEKPGANNYSDNAIGTAWEPMSLLVTRPLRRIEVGNEHRLGDEDTISDARTTTLSLSSDGTTALTIQPLMYWGMPGKVTEIDLNTLVVTRVIQDSDATNAVYVPNSKDFIYHRAQIDFPGATPKAQWLYRFSRASETSELIFADSIKENIRHTLGVFDVSPDATKLLLPYFDTVLSGYGVYEYDLVTKASTKIISSLSKSISSLKYSHDGKRIAYSLIPSWPERFNEIGIITLASGEKQLLDAAPDNEYAWESILSAWSLDDKAVSLSVANLSFPFGPYYVLYVLPIR